MAHLLSKAADQVSANLSGLKMEDPAASPSQGVSSGLSHDQRYV